MDIAIYILAILLGIAGFFGSVLPILPGPTLSWFAWMLLLIPKEGRVTWTSVAVWGGLLLIVTLLDNFGSTWMTNRLGGSKWGTRGCFIGMLLGLFFFAPWGLILGPFLGAFIGELIGNATTGRAFKVACISFVAFLLTTGLKLIYCAVMLFYMVKAFIGIL